MSDPFPICSAQRRAYPVVLVRQALTAAFGEAIQYTPVEGQGTLVQAPTEVKSEPFQALTHAAIALAQGQPTGESTTGSGPDA